jgi:hypothetical protein
MGKEGTMRQFRTKETITKATSFLRRQGIEKVGNFTVVQIERNKDGELKLGNGSVTNFYYKDGHVETSTGIMVIIRIPNELKDKIAEELQKK